MDLTAGEEALVALSAALATRSDAARDQALRQAAVEAEPRAVEEVILQSYLFLGYPAALNAFAAWRASGPHPAEASGEDPAGWQERGRDVCSAVYGNQYEALRTNVRRLHPDMERWMVEEGYGKVLGRPGLGLGLRELCIAAQLAVLDAPRQLYSHLRGALNVGEPVSRVEAALKVAARYNDAEVQESASGVWRSVLQRAGG